MAAKKKKNKKKKMVKRVILGILAVLLLQGRLMPVLRLAILRMKQDCKGIC